MTRFEMPDEVRNALNVAVKLRVIDAAEAYAMATEHGSNFKVVMEELVYAAYVSRHDESGREAHAALCEINDAYHAAIALD